MAWIDCWERQPDKDGEYMVQTLYDNDGSMSYTTIGGWNTHLDSDGNLYNKSMIDETRILRWYEIEENPPLPPEWAREARTYKTWKEWNNAF